MKTDMWGDPEWKRMTEVWKAIAMHFRMMACADRYPKGSDQTDFSRWWDTEMNAALNPIGIRYKNSEFLEKDE